MDDCIRDELGILACSCERCLSDAEGHRKAWEDLDRLRIDTLRRENVRLRARLAALERIRKLAADYIWSREHAAQEAGGVWRELVKAVGAAKEASDG